VLAAMFSERKPVTQPTIIEKAKSFYDEMTIIDKCTFSESWLQNFKEPRVKGGIQMEHPSHYLCSPSIAAVTKNYL
jgi:hypothetical protein